MSEQQTEQHEVVAGEVVGDVEETDATEAEQAVAEELAEAELPTAEALAGIVGDEFGIEMVSPWGDRWIWVKIDADRAQEIYKVLGDPVTIQRVGDNEADAHLDAGPQQAGPSGGETSAE